LIPMDEVLELTEPIAWRTAQGAQLLFQVFFFPISLFRWVVMRTSKIPQWPQWVEDECRIEPNDPWERDGRQRA
jgi:hypothetical protein